jgi:hypothetical protein
MNVEFKEDKIRNVMRKLSEDRPIFHSEDDFKFSLAWKIKNEYKENLEIRLEKNMDNVNRYLKDKKEECNVSKQNNKQNNKNEKIDIFIIANGINGLEKIGIELKYITKKLEVENIKNNEKFILKTQGAENNRSYDSWKDVERLENFILNREIDRGFTLWLTNDYLLYADCKKDMNKEYQFDNFRICNGRELNEHCLKWINTRGQERKDRSDPIYILENYKITWENYSNIKLEIIKNNYRDLIKETDKVKPKHLDYQFKFSILEIQPNRTLI